MKHSESRRPVIGVLINQIEGRYQSLIRKGLSDFAEDAGVSLKTYVGRSLGSPYGNEDSFNEIYSLARGSLHESAPQGLVVTAGSIGSFLEPLKNREFLESFGNIPLVTIGMSLSGFPSVETDNSLGMAALVDHAATVHGFERFAFLSGPDQSQDAAMRFDSWKAALDRHGIPESRRIVYRGDLSYRCGQAIASRLDVSGPLPFDILSCANDDMALGFIEAMSRRGLLCPRDYAITGFDDIPEAGFLTPLLTTVHQPLYEQAFNAGRILLMKIADPSFEAPAENRLRCAPVFRESCGCSPVPLIRTRRPAGEDLSPAAGRAERAAVSEWLTRELQLTGSAQSQALDAYTSLCNSASLDLRKFVERPLFLQVFSGLLDSTGGWSDFSNRWHVLLSLVRRSLSDSPSDMRTLRYLEDLFASAFALLTQKSGEHHARELSFLRDTQYLFRDLSFKLGSVADEAALRETLAAIVPLMGFTRVVLALHRNGAKALKTQDEEGGFYDDAELFPCFDAGGGRDSVRMPLLGNRESYGYIILEGSGVDPVVFESLRDQISQALESLSLRRERDSADLALRESEERYRDIAAAVPVMILETDTLLRITYANPSALKGLCLQEAGGLTSLKKFLEADDASAVDELVHRLDRERILDYPGLRLICPEHKRYIPVARISGIVDRKGNLRSIRWNALDPLTFLGDGLLPDSDFFANRNITKREKEIIELQLQGYRIKDIAEKLFIAESTVKGHLTQVYNKLGITGKGELLRLLKDEQGGRYGFSAYVLSLVNRLLSIEDPS
ncbi:substrate-binding domain-containing protein [Treponema zuelzerae]|uniref:Substrate-binding domain-containing protein n=1 Tax=Teretinema zuelzerae TaxID=156 RepID=A0AAE3JIA2_9SPIR|nr:substrate-binding domain-containing protein [Teretinema zuelzerae]MCD1654028.1 substrate-binding domain-containing protein [Teretinema zuelzerae]